MERERPVIDDAIWALLPADAQRYLCGVPQSCMLNPYFGTDADGELLCDNPVAAGVTLFNVLLHDAHAAFPDAVELACTFAASLSRRAVLMHHRS
jgi:hypothetical protein